MKVAVNTPTGNIGRALTERLLEGGAEVILLTRSPEKVKAFADRGATVQEGSLEDADFVVRATKGVDALFWLTPPNFETDKFRDYQNKLGDIVARAVTENRIPRVVDLSSVGAHLSKGTGPIAGLGDIEKKLETTGSHVTHLRPEFFMENFFMSVQTIAGQNAVFLPIRGSVKAAMIATSDIAEVAAQRLLDNSWTGRSVLELVGPAQVSFDNAAETLGSALGMELKHITTTPEQTHEALTGMGVPAKTADLFLEMYGAFDAGKVTPESPGTAKVGSTTLGTFAERVFRPGFDAMNRT